MVLWSRLSLAACLVIISYLAVVPTEPPVVGALGDKATHALAFLALSLTGDFSFPDRPFRAKVVVLLAYGAAIEVVQYFLPNRYPEVADLGADGLGLLAYAAALPLLRRIPLLSWRWKTEP
ncbi:MAG: VanZ family protein [Gemmatimonadetes bacterium]|nr:VanZ family protein [Gemmatimonadota bacterium]